MAPGALLVAVAAWMLAALAGCIVAALVLDLVDAPRTWLIPFVAGALAYFSRQGHYALWPRTSPSDLPFLAALVALVGLLEFPVLAVVLLHLLGLASASGSVLVTVAASAYVTACAWRPVEATSPRIRAIRYVLCLVILVVVGLGFAWIYGLDVGRAQVQAFYSTVAQVDAALLLAVAFQSGWARDRRALEGFVLLASGALLLSVSCSLVAIGRGADSAAMFALTVSGLAAGLVLVSLGAVQNVAPDLLEGWRSGQRKPLSQTINEDGQGLDPARPKSGPSHD